MALNYEVKKKVFGFDQTKTEKYVAQLKTLGIIQFGDLCDEVTKIGMAPRGVVKMVLDGLIDTLNININKGFSVQLGDFGCFRRFYSGNRRKRGRRKSVGITFFQSAWNGKRK